MGMEVLLYLKGLVSSSLIEIAENGQKLIIFYYSADQNSS